MKRANDAVVKEQIARAVELAVRPGARVVAAQAAEREAHVLDLARFVGLDEARRAVELAYQVGVEEAQASPVVLASERVQDYVRAVRAIAARGEPLPQTAEELRAIPEAGRRRAQDLARILGL